MSSEVHPPSYVVANPLPQGLCHKPVYAMPYEPFDGYNSPITDVKYLSVGLAQYDQRDVSVKTMRHTGKKWSRQAEELPIHRVFDMALFAAKVLFDSDGNECELKEGLFQNQKIRIRIRKDEERSKEEMKAFEDWLHRNRELLKTRLNALAVVLDDLRSTERI